MRITNAKISIGKTFVPGSIDFGDKITAVSETVLPADVDANGAYLIPGLVDIHTHAAMGADASDGDSGGMPVMAEYYAADGVTSWCPTTMTLQEPVLKQAVEVIRDFRRTERSAKVAGINLEGPFVSYAKRGAQAAENIHQPDIGIFRRLNEASGGLVRLVTVAPEEPGAVEFIQEASKTAAVSIGHTTADYATAAAAFEAGASHATHLFNAMPPLGHREPGVIGAALDAGASVELISDGFHIHPSVVRLTHKLFGDRLVLISDSLRCAGMPDGNYTLGGQPITVTEGKAFISGTTTIAGSSVHLMDAVRRAVSFGIPLEDAVYAASTAPAKVIGMERKIGSIAPGLAADFVLLDNCLNTLAVYIDGRRIR